MGQGGKAQIFNWMERKQRRLNNMADEYEFSYDCRDPAVLRKLLEIKTDQCRAMGWREMFAERWVRAMFEQMLELREEVATGVLSALRVNGEIVAVDFSLRSDSIYAGWIIAYDPAWSQLSPGESGGAMSSKQSLTAASPASISVRAWTSSSDASPPASGHCWKAPSQSREPEPECSYPLST